MTNPDMLHGNVYWGSGLPECDSAFETGQIEKIFADIPLMRITGVRAIKVSDQVEESATEKLRNCRAAVLGSNTNEYSVHYKIEKTEGDKFYTTVNILP